MGKVYPSDLNHKQRTAAELMLQGKSRQEICAAISTSEAVLSRWMDGKLGSYLNDLWSDRMRQQTQRAVNAAEIGLKVLIDIAQDESIDPTPRVSAAKALLQAGGMTGKAPQIMITFGDAGQQSGSPDQDIQIELHGLRSALQGFKIEQQSTELAVLDAEYTEHPIGEE